MVNINRNTMTPYESVFECQLCKERFKGFSTNMVTDDDIGEYSLNDRRKHMCKNGGIGIAVLVGFNYVPQ